MAFNEELYEELRRELGGRLRPEDRIVLRRLVATLTHVEEMEATIMREGYEVTDVTGTSTRRHPLLTPLNQAATTLTALCIQLGMTPSARKRLGPAEEEQAPSLADLLAGE